MTRDPILIVGGGLGGLTTALALSHRGLTARVLEGAPEFGAIGYGIHFGPDVFHVFDRLGFDGAGACRRRFSCGGAALPLGSLRWLAPWERRDYQPG